MSRFSGRTVIVHEGFPEQWLERLLRQPGGAGHLRIDVRRLPTQNPSPIEWLVQAHVVPLGLPLPLVVRIQPEALHLRHLRRREGVVHPSEIGWFLIELDRRYHACLTPDATGYSVTRGIPEHDNEAESLFDL